MTTLSNVSPVAPIVYRTISGYVGYRVSNRGVVESCWRSAGKGKGWVLSDVWRKVSQRIDTRVGFQATPQVWLRTAPNKGEHRIVAQLVLEAFVGPCPPGMEACHDDGNEIRNWLDNLRWDTHVQNCQDKYQHGTVLFAEKHPNSRFSRRDVLEMRFRYAYGEICGAIGKDFSADHSTVWNIVTFRTRKQG